MPKTQSNLAQHHKNNWLFRRNNRLFIPVHKYKLKLKSLRDREIVHTGLYWFTFNQELHPVFLEITGESTKQSTLDYLQHHQRSDINALKTHIPLAQHKHYQECWSWQPQEHTALLSFTHRVSSKYKRITLVTEKIWNQYKMKILFHTLFIKSNLKENFNSSKAKSVKKSNLIFFIKSQFLFVT